uniref:Uncharacterized protein n=1 Tax=Musa acuminata TaxID=4641 RepID=Q1EPB8_MUSAC|nr:hypothetical protein MA4_78I12.80 [Musa acuminata]
MITLGVREFDGSSDSRQRFCGNKSEKSMSLSKTLVGTRQVDRLQFNYFAPVEPPKPGGGTAWAQSPSETGWCNRPSQEVAPLGLGLRALAERCNRLSQAVAPPELGLRALAGGATAPDKRWHPTEAQSSSFAKWCNR